MSQVGCIPIISIQKRSACISSTNVSQPAYGRNGSNPFSSRRRERQEQRRQRWEHWLYNSGRNVRRFPFLFYCFCFILSFLVLYCLILSYRFFRVFLPIPQRVAGTSAQEFRPLFRTRDGPLSTPLACPCEPPKLSSTLLKSSTVPLLHCAKCSSELRV